MLRKITAIGKITLLLASLLLLCGCKKKVTAVSPISDEEVITFVCSEIQKEFGDEVTAKITSKTDLEVPTEWFDGPINYVKVKNGHEYKLEVQKKDGTGPVVTAGYEDGYILNDIEYEAVFWHKYESTGIFGVIQDKLEAELKLRFTAYRIFRSLPDMKTCRYNIFLSSSDADALKETISRMQEILTSVREDYSASLDMFIYKDEAVFRAIGFQKIENTPFSDDGEETFEQCTSGIVTRGSLCDGFNADFFNSDGTLSAALPDECIDPGKFDSMAFWYHWKPHAGIFANLTRVFGINK